LLPNNYTQTLQAEMKECYWLKFRVQ